MEETKSEDDVKENLESDLHTIDDGVFKVTIGGAANTMDVDENKQTDDKHDVTNAVIPSPRMNALLTFKRSSVYLYGGIFEDGDRQITYDDMYLLDLHKMDTWKVLEKGNVSAQQWEESSSSGDDDDDDDDDDDMEVQGAVGGEIK